MKTTDNIYQHEDQDGGYMVRFGNRTIEVTFTGFLNVDLVRKYCADLELVLRVIDWRYWVFFGDLSECDEQSTETRRVLVDLHKRFILEGCIVDAYAISSDVILKQVSNTRKVSGITREMNDNVFSTRQQAVEFIERTLEKIDKKSVN